MKDEKESSEFLFETEGEAKSFIEVVVNITESILKSEANINKFKKDFYLNNIDKLELKDFTSMISIDDKDKMDLIFSFDESLIKYIFINYTNGLEFSEEEYETILGETAGDIINVVLGLSIGKYARSRRIFNLSTPVIVNEAKSIDRYKNTNLYAAYLSSEFGNMSLFVVSPGEKIKKQIMNLRVS